MTEAPERIWASCETPDAKMKSGRWHQSPYGMEYISRAAHDAAVSAARKEGMLEAARVARAEMHKSPYYENRVAGFRYGMRDGFEAAAQAIEDEASK